MSKPLQDKDLKRIEEAVAAHAGGVGIRDLERDLRIPRRQLQLRLRRLVEAGRLVAEGERRWTKYRTPAAAAGVPAHIPLLPQGAEIRQNVRRPLTERKPVGYNRTFLDAYRPNRTAWLSDAERARLWKQATPSFGELPAGTYAKQILNRLLIDLSWNSSRLEGNTYSLLDTRRLISFGQEAEGKARVDAQMILNHKEAIEFLVSAAPDIGFNRYTILNLHALLANNLLADPSAAGRLRHISVGIEKSVFHPLDAPPLIEECFDQLLMTAAAIRDPFEQALFVLAQLPYLQPFDDVNKRVSRLAANIPFIRANLTPLSFTDLPADLYTEAILGVYELNRVDLLKDVFMWACERSALRYAAVRQSLGEPDPFRLRHRDGLREIVREIVLEQADRKQAFRRIAEWAESHVAAEDRERFREVAEEEILSLHEGNFARYRIRPSEFEKWRKVWEADMDPAAEQ